MLYKWRSKFGGMDTSMIKRMKELEAENTRHIYSTNGSNGFSVELHDNFINSRVTVIIPNNTFTIC